MSLLNLSSLRGIFASPSKKSTTKKSPSQKLQRTLAVDSLEDRVLLSVTPTTATDILVNTEYSQDQTTQTNGNAISVDDDGDFVVAWTRGDNIYRDNFRNVGWYNNDGELQIYTDRNYIDQSYTDENGVEHDVILTAYIDAGTGAQVIDYNIYGRYFTDEVQRLTLDTSNVADNEMLYSIKLKTGNKYVQNITFDCTDTTWTSSENMTLHGQQNVTTSHTAVYEITYNGQTERFVYDDVDDGMTLTPDGGMTMAQPGIVLGIQNAKNMQDALQNIFGEGHVKVTALTGNQFQVEFDTEVVAAQGGAGIDFAQLLTCQADYNLANMYEFLGTYYPNANVTWVRQPEEFEIFVVYETKYDKTGEVSGYGGIDVAATAEQITMAFQQIQADHAQGKVFFDPVENYSPIVGPTTEIDESRSPDYEVSVVPVYGLGEKLIGFDITYVNSSGKQDMPQLIVEEMNVVSQEHFEARPEEFARHGWAITNLMEGGSSAAYVNTLKQNSTEFRVNPTSDDFFNKKSKIYTATEQLDASVALDADGDFVISWTSEVLPTRVPGSFSDIYVRMFSASMYSAFTSTNETTGVQEYELLNDGQGYSVKSDAILANTQTNDPQIHSCVAIDNDGNFTVVWASHAQNFSYMNGVSMQRFTFTGNKIGEETRVDTELTGQALHPQVAMSPDGTQIAVTWDWLMPSSTATLDAYASSCYVQVYGYTTDENKNKTFSQFTGAPVIVGGGGSTSVTYNKLNEFIVGWQAVDGADLLGNAVQNSYVSQYKWTGGALNLMRDTYRVNSASMNAASNVYWTGGTYLPKVAMDADGDFLVTYNGVGLNATENFDPTTSLPYLAEQINDDVNSDLLAYFDPTMESFALLPRAYDNGSYGSQVMWIHGLQAFLTNGDVDSIIEMVLARAQQPTLDDEGNIVAEGCTDEQFSRLSRILHSVFDLVKGEGDGVNFSMFDAATGNNSYPAGQVTILQGDSIANATRDGQNAKYYITIDRNSYLTGEVEQEDFAEDTNVWQNIVIGIAWRGEVRNLTVDLRTCYDWNPNNRYTFNNVQAALLIERAIEAAYATAWGQNDYYEGCVEVRALSTDEADPTNMRLLDDTEFDLNGGLKIELNPLAYPGYAVSDATNIAFPADYACFEVQFTGVMHDAVVSFGSNRGQVLQSAVQQIDMREAEGRYFRVAVFDGDAGVRTLAADVIGQNGTMGGVAATIRAALDALGYPAPDCRVETVTLQDDDGNDYQVIQITFTGRFAGRNLMIQIDTTKPDVAENAQDPYPDWIGNQLRGVVAQVVVPGAVIARYPVNTITHSIGDAGVTQGYSSVEMEPDGDFTVAWTQFNQDASRTVTSQSIYYRAFNEEFDTAGPEVVAVYYSDGQKIEQGGQIVDNGAENAANAIIVTFDEEMLDAKKITTEVTAAQAAVNQTHSITNPENWVLVHDGKEIANAISEIYFGMNASADPYIQNMGVVALRENKWEAVLVLNPDVNLEGGKYQLVLKKVVTDVSGNPLGSDGTNTAGDDWPFDFDIVSGSTETTVVTPKVEDPDDPNSPVVLDPDGNVVEREQDQSFYDPDAAELWAPSATASDPEGDTVTVWRSSEEGYEGIFAQITYKKWDVNDARTVRNEGKWTFQVTDEKSASFASVDMDGSGNFVVTWTQNDAEDGASEDLNVWAQLFDLNGNAISEAFCVNSTTAGAQKFSQVAMSLEGDFVITWQGESKATSWDIYAQRYDAAGKALGAVDEIQALNITKWNGWFTLTYTDADGVNHETEQIECTDNTMSLISDILKALNNLGLEGVKFSVAAASDTQVLITISVLDDADADVMEMKVKVYETTSESGSIEISTVKNGAGAEFMVNETTDNKQVYAAIDMDYSGNFVISWTGYGNGESAYQSNIYARQFASSTSLGYIGKTASSLASKYSDYIVRVDGTDENPVTNSGIAFITVDAYCGTGVLLSDGGNLYVLTAAHVVTGDDFEATKDNTTLQFYTNDGDVMTAYMSECYVYENYSSRNGTGDVAIIKLATSLSGIVTGYDINRDMKKDVGATYTRYGYGIYGEGSTGATENVDGSMHTGKNEWEYAEQGLLYYDFDDGTDANNTLQKDYGIASSLGLGNEETCACHGDSGGPCFVDGLIAGICHGGDSDISAYGTLGIDTQVAYFASWIDDITGAAQQQITGAKGSEFLVNADNTAGTQKWSSVALDADGDFAITWTGSAADTDITNDVYARRYASSGDAVGGSFLVNTTTDNKQQLSKVSMDADGDFVVVWESFQEHGDGTTLGAADSWGIYAQRYAANGKMAALTYLGPNGENGSEYQVNTVTAGDQRIPNVAMTAAGDSLFTWQSDESDSEGIYTRSYYQAIDDAGPVVVRVNSSYTEEDKETGAVTVVNVLLREGAVVDGNLEYLEVTFDEQLMGQYTNENGTNSIMNTSNWNLVRDNVSVTSEIIDHIELVGYDMEDPSYLGSNGISEKNIFRVVFKDGTVLEDGSYTLVIRDRVQDRSGNALDGNRDGAAGGSYELHFTISSEPVDEGSKVKPTDPTDSDPGALDKTVNNATAGDQEQPAIAMNDSGDYVVVWVSEVIDNTAPAATTDDTTAAADGTGDDTTATIVKQTSKKVIMAQRFNRYGETIGAEFFVSDFVDGIQEAPDVAMDANGNFVVTWTVNGRDENNDKVIDNNELSKYEVYARVFRASGAAITNSFLVCEDPDAQQKESAIAFAPDGKQFIVTWTNINSQDSDDTYGIFAQRFNFNGTAYGERFLVNQTQKYEQCQSDVAMDADYNVVVTWQSSSDSKTALDVYARHFNAINAAYSDDVLVNTTVKDDQRSASVAVNDAGQFIVAWASQSGAGYNVMFQCFDSDMTKIGGEMRANTFQTYSQYQPSVTICRKAENSTNFAISWSSYGQEGLADKSWGVYMNVYDGITTRNSVTATKQEVLVNSYKAWDEDSSAIAMDAYGSVGVVWVGPDEAKTGATVTTKPQDTDIFNKVYIRANVPNYTPIGSTVEATLNVKQNTNNTSISFNSTKENGGGTVTTTGTKATILSASNSSNRFVFDAASGTPKVTLNDVEIKLQGTEKEYVFDAAGAGSYSSAVAVQGLGGESISVVNGTVIITGTSYTLTILNARTFVFNGENVTASVTAASDEIFSVEGTSASLQASGASYRIEGCISVIASGSGSAAAKLSGTEEKDEFEVLSSQVRLASAKCAVTATNFGTTFLSGSEGDSVVFRQNGTYTVDANTVGFEYLGRTVNASGFTSVNASAGGAASIVTSADANRIEAKAGSLVIQGVDFTQTFTGLGTINLTGNNTDVLDLTADADVQVQADLISTGVYTINGFGEVVLHRANAVTLEGSAGDDVLTVNGSSAEFTTDDYSLTIDSFSQLTALASEGNDSAVLYDSAADDSFTLAQNSAVMNGKVFVNSFNSVSVFCVNGGNDSVSITGSTGADAFSLAADAVSAKLSDGTEFKVTGAPNITLDGNGGADALAATDSDGDDVFTLEPGSLSASLGTGAAWNVQNVSDLRVHQLHGGNDALTLNDSIGDDKVVVSPKFVTMTSSDASVTASGFGNLIVNSRYGNDVAVMYDSAANDTAAVSAEGAVSLRGSGFFNQVNGFRKVNLYAVNGGKDTATVSAEFEAVDSIFSAKGSDWSVKGIGFEF